LINNYCGKNVWFKATSGSAPFSRPGIYNCATNDDCLFGSECHANRGTPLCFWNVPTPGNVNFRVPAGGHNRLDFPILNNGQDIVWSGNIVACLDGTCSDTPVICDSIGCGGAGGVNMAEFTWATNAVDFYDVSIINGVNIPMELFPVLPDGFHLDGSDPYRCGNPGGSQMLTPVPSSSWVFNNPHVEYNSVSKGGPSCSSDADCTGNSFGTKCGLSDNPDQSPRFRLTCGNFLGYWTADQICGVDLNFGSPFYCSKPLTNAASAPGLTLWHMMACVGTGVDSCYANGAQTSCCGCVNWNGVNGVNASMMTEQCVNSNPEWSQYILPQLIWLKQACPTCYTYPYDDMSSTFVCSMADPSIGQKNLLNYELNFCPNNKPIKIISSPASAFNATIVNADFVAKISPAVGASGAVVQFTPVASVDWVIFNYIVQYPGVSIPPVQTSLRLSYSSVSTSWSVNMPDPGEGSSVQYTFNYLFSPKTTSTFGFVIPAPPSPVPVKKPPGSSPAASPTFSASLIPNTNATNGAIGVNVQFNTTASGASWVILHFNINNGGPQNVQMGLSSALSSTVWNYFIPSQLFNGTTIKYSFTYLITGSVGAIDSATGSWIFITLPPPAPSVVPVGIGSTSNVSIVVSPSSPVSNPSSSTYTYDWVPGAWSGCDCTGTQTRTIACKRNDGLVVDNSFCSGGSQSTSQSCPLPASCTAPGQAPGSVLTTTDFTVQHSYAPITSTDVILFQVNPSINFAASWVVLHYQLTGGPSLNVQMNAVSGSAQFSFSVSSFPISSTISYSFTYFLNGWGARDSSVYTYSPAPMAGSYQIVGGENGGYGTDEGGRGSSSTLVVALVCSFVAVGAALAAVAAYRNRFWFKSRHSINRNSNSNDTITPGLPVTSTSGSMPVVKEVELSSSAAAQKSGVEGTASAVGSTMAELSPLSSPPLRSPGPMDELISPTYRKQEEEQEERERYAAAQGVTRRTSV